jgi:hypothetical protein
MNGAMRKEAGVSWLSVIWSGRHDPAARILNVLRVPVARSTTMPDNLRLTAPADIPCGAWPYGSR